MGKLCKRPSPQSEMEVSLKSLSWASGDVHEDHRSALWSSPHKRVRDETPRLWSSRMCVQIYMKLRGFLRFLFSVLEDSFFTHH